MLKYCENFWKQFFMRLFLRFNRSAVSTDTNWLYKKLCWMDDSELKRGRRCTGSLNPRENRWTSGTAAFFLFYFITVYRSQPLKLLLSLRSVSFLPTRSAGSERRIQRLKLTWTSKFYFPLLVNDSEILTPNMCINFLWSWQPSTLHNTLEILVVLKYEKEKKCL